jgi:hypothetical protein
MTTPTSDRHRRDVRNASVESLVAFFEERLTEDLAQLWDREGERGDDWTGPGLATQVAIVDELLTTVRGGRLPSRREARILLYGYGAHPDYDPAWVRLLVA